MTNAELLKLIWDTLYDLKANTRETIEKFFHPAYEQCINGIKMNRAEYIQHVIEQKKNITVEKIDYKYMLEKNNELFAIYYPRGTNKNNLATEAEVAAYFRFEKQQLIKIHGLVRLIQGNLTDLDMKNS